MRQHVVPATPNLMRLLNRQTILQFMLERPGGVTRTDLRDRFGLSLPTISSVVKELVDEGWLLEAGDGVSQGGKPPQIFRLNPNARFLGAIQMNHDQIRMRVQNLLGENVLQEDFETPNIAAKDICAFVSAKMMALLSSSEEVRQQFLGLGISVPGVVDERGYVSEAPEFGWDDEPIKDYYDLFFQEGKVIVENDVHLAVIGEAWRCKLKKETMIYVHLGYGIGAALFIEGKLYRGAHFSAGEIGHFIVNPETVAASGRAGSSSEQGSFESHFGLLKLLEEKGNREKEENLLRHLAYGFVNIITLMDPNIIVIGGEMPLHIDGFLDRLTNHLKNFLRNIPEISITPYGNDGPLYGACRCVLQQLFSSNLVGEHQGG